MKGRDPKIDSFPIDFGTQIFVVNCRELLCWYILRVYLITGVCIYPRVPAVELFKGLIVEGIPAGLKCALKRPQVCIEFYGN